VSSWSLPIALAFTALCLACDDNPAPGAGADTGGAASKASATPIPSAAPSATAAASAPPATPRKVRGPCSHDPVATFEDPKIEAVVRRQLPQPEGPITRASLAKIRTFNVAQTKMDDLDPCLFADLSGLNGLYLPPGTIEDLSPIKGLIRLERFGAVSTAVKDITPIAGLAKLDQLDLSHTPLTDITPIGSLIILTELKLDDTTVKDLTPLAKTTKLEMLSIQNTPVADLTPLKNLTKLKKLYIAGSLVQDISPVQGIPGLKIFQQPSK
jgi:internalin A